jgi:pimeloyl-ACP methyl ester carboxylesterase
MGAGEDSQLAIEPYRIDVPEGVLTDLAGRLRYARWPDQIPGSGWDLGTDRSELQELCRYWANEYDWRQQEHALNGFSHFTTTVYGQRVHFLHERSPRPDAVPLLLLHGWPGSIVEFLRIVRPLTHPEDAAMGFHVVVPSLPGFGWSGPTTVRGWNLRRIGAAMGELMAGIGYSRFAVQGGDAGAIAATELAMLQPDRLIGLHLNLIVVGPPDPDHPLAGLSEKEVGLVSAAKEWSQQESGYSWIQGTRPQTLAYGLYDSPVGLAAWILEKFRRWSDCNGDVWSRFSQDEILTNIMAYWVTGTIGSSMRIYFETRQTGILAGFRGPVKVPTAVAVFPKEHNRYPRPWAEACYQIHRWTEMPRGGHFAAMEEPHMLVNDIRSFIESLDRRP